MISRGTLCVEDSRIHNMNGITGFRELHPTTRQLLSARALRRVGQGILVVDFALYLHALQWSAVAIGLLLSASGIFGAVLSLMVGTSSDRLRRKPFLLVYESIALLASIAALLTSQTAILRCGCSAGRLSVVLPAYLPGVRTPTGRRYRP